MNSTEKAQFTADSLAETIYDYVRQFKKTNKKLLKTIEDSIK